MKEILFKLLLRKTDSSSGNNTNKIAAEIHECLEYFEEHEPGIKDDHAKLAKIHGIGIAVGRMSGTENEYFWEIKGVVKKAGKDVVGPQEYEEVLEKIHGITIPYAEHIRAKNKKH